MMLKFTTPTLACTALVLTALNAGAAQAAQDNWPYWYLGLWGAPTMTDSSDVSYTGGGVTNADYDTGYAAGVSLGYKPPFRSESLQGLRFELELATRRNDLDTLNNGFIASYAESDLQTLMFNALLDIPMHDNVAGYVGVGAGYGQATLDITSGLGNVTDHDSVAAYQAMIGFSWEPETMPLTIWNIGYRYLTTSEASYATATGNVDVDYSNHGLELGVKFRF